MRTKSCNFVLLNLIFAIVAITGLLSSCAGTMSLKKKDDRGLVRPPEESYQRGLELFDRKRYKEAAQEFSDVFFFSPGSKVTADAELMEAYSLYNIKEYGEAIDILDGFITLHPTHPRIAEAFYLRASAYKDQISGVEHDYKKPYEAKLALEAVINRFPASEYAQRAKEDLKMVMEVIAGTHMYIGRFYQKNNKLIAALRRFNKVVTMYPETSHYPEALYRMAECYSMLGYKEEGNWQVEMLAEKYPESKWYKYALSLR